jgi:hypothetical protein
MASIIGTLFKGASLINGAKDLITEQKRTKLADIVIDATLSEVIKYGSAITEHPVETKTSISDHIFKQPLSIKIEGSITDSPILIMGIFENPLQKNSLKSMSANLKKMLPFQESDKPSQQGYDALKALYNERSLITIVTKFECFQNMAIKSLTFNSNCENRGKLEFTTELVQVMQAKVAVTNISISNKRLQRLTAPVKNLGNQDLDKSWVKTSVDWIKGFF